VELPRGTVLAEIGEDLQYTYFPHTAVVSLIKDMHGGQRAEMASFGREALIGLAFENTPLQSSGRYIVQIPGAASRIDRNRLQDAMAARPAIMQMVLRYTEILWALALQSVACNASHSVEARCSRWIVATHDRVSSDDLPLTHEALAETLGVQRSTVSAILRSLQMAGLIRQERGSITVLDRPGLQETACECYRILRGKYLELLPVPDRRP
jgi:CRP-like cAMP-binding protein